ncbi:acyl-CoA dehydrogenase family protein [Rhizobium leguminosarum]|uniref:Alkylation response protein AidB-like acyl-CoA dehydrogenase n=1 Tax=Rhizobium leguminosarum TaxID=384 RepID=A0A7W9ZMN2_RHILE|nr:acyl-CoA dehydrogenase family protein [Rhizobium leguminosarum]MBB6219453.1 alkylation response protein AidB-like acyl-CoA dehydrogenase [Rhizobium leguminosarum]
MTRIDEGWGRGPSLRYEKIAGRFRPLFKRIGERAIERDQERRLPFEEVRWLREAGFGALRIPAAYGGAEITLPELFALLIELSAADPNITNIFRSHQGFTEDLLNAPKDGWRDEWLGRLGRGEMVGSGFSELTGNVGDYATTIVREAEGYRLNGAKFYTTGSIYADWINLGAVDGSSAPIAALVPTSAPGVEILDDWDGFGQAMSGSGTARFDNVRLEPLHIKPNAARFPYTQAFFQLVHFASLAGIGRAAATELARHVGARARLYPRGNGEASAQDPQVLEVVGRVKGPAYAAGAIVLNVAEALQRSYETNVSGVDPDETDVHHIADIETSQSVTVISKLILEATTVLFDALGASAAKRATALDRHWRNARTITSHNPRIYHDRVVGEFAVSGKRPAPVGNRKIITPFDRGSEVA